ncbi:MAG: BatA domain-containing protein [Chitinophagales bacterium]|nr:BatA domain-containing protein [Chitinophagales bacterium]
MFSNLTHIAFANQWVLWLVPLVIVLAALWWYFYYKKNFASLKLSSTNSFAGFTNPFRATLKKLLPALRLLAIISLLVALARPQTSYDEEKMTTEGIDIVLAVDVSSSMLAKDFSPNRL